LNPLAEPVVGFHPSTLITVPAVVQQTERLMAGFCADATRHPSTAARTPARRRSNIQSLEIRDTLLREFPVLLDKVVLDPAYLRSGEGLHPIDSALAQRNLRASPAAASRRRTLGWRSRNRSV